MYEFIRFLENQNKDPLDSLYATSTWTVPMKRLTSIRAVTLFSFKASR